MCDDWRSNYFDKFSCDGSYLYNGNGEVIIKGKLKDNIPNTLISFWAACPPDYIQSYTGSGLPFATPTMAYDNTPNRGSTKPDISGQFEFKIQMPNSYYNGLGTVYIKPHVNIRVKNDKNDNIHDINLSDGIPFRMLTYPGPPNTASRCSSLFYNQRYKLPDVRTQEQILLDSEYPQVNKMPDNFWGLAIPHP